MWEGWKNNEDSTSCKNYELMVKSRAEVSQPNVLLTVSITETRSASPTWMVHILSFTPSAGEYILFDDSFANVEDAEMIAWEKAQEISQGFPRL
jgi:hypothetical protein